MSDILSETEVQWRAIWFPPDRPQRSFVGEEASVRRRAAEMDEVGWHPLVERREVTTTPWRTVDKTTQVNTDHITEALRPS